MTFVSYAQNFEDVMLWRALKHIANGFYIDVGAQDPVVDSVSRGFYEIGWRGVHVEPTARYSTMLRQNRPDETVMQVALGSTVGEVKFYEFPDTGLSTIDGSIAERHRQDGFQSIETIVPVKCLADLLQDYENRDVHWLKIDVEGFEKEVLEGWNDSPTRPWIVVVESTVPRSQEENYLVWEPILLDKGYQFVYFDGLNRYYVSEKHNELSSAFSIPPNVFDDFVLSGQASSPLCSVINGRVQMAERKAEKCEAVLATKANELASLEKRLIDSEKRFIESEKRCIESEKESIEFKKKLFESEKKLLELEARAAASEHQARQFEAKAAQAVSSDALVQALTSSRSWKVTTPLRRLSEKLGWFKMGCRAWLGFVPGSRPRRIAKSCLVAACNCVQDNPSLQNLASRVFSRVPGLKERLRGVISDRAPVEYVTPDFFVKSPAIPSNDPEYASWIQQNSLVPERLLAWDRYPDCRLSILLPYVFGDIKKIDQTIAALQAQICPNWQVLLAPFGSADLPVTSEGALSEAGDGRILSCSPAAQRGEVLRAAAEMADGDIILVLEPGDVLPTHAVSTFVTRMGENPQLMILYADEDVIESGLRRSPQLKPEWSPELLRSYNYFGRPTVIRKSALESAGSFSSDAGAAAEWDLWLRASERFMDRVATPCIGREAQVLCHRHPDSNSGRVLLHGTQGEEFKECLRRHWMRAGIAANVSIQPDGTLHAAWEIENPPLVSVIIPNKNRANLLEVSLDGLWEKTAYPRIEIIVVDNGSTEHGTLDLYAVAAGKGVRIVDFNEPFNYSRACNRGAAVANGDLLLFLNNDIEVTRPDWLAELVRQATLPGVGVVGTKLVYPDGVLQHSGVVLGMHVCGLVFHRGDEFGWGPLGSPSVTRNWMGIMGACQMIRRTVFDRIGGFDETYQVAMSDIKLSMDAWRSGYRTVNAPMAKLIHHEGASRGKSNPLADIIKTIRDIYAKGLEDDGYFHPGLSAIPAVPTLRRPGEPSTLASLAEHYSRMIGGDNDVSGVDLFDDRSLAMVSGRRRPDIVWLPDPAGVIDGPESAARFIIDLLRGRADLRERFPLALTGGAQGAFAAWLKGEALGQFGIAAEAARFIDAVFEQRLADRARQAMLFEYDLRDKEPFLFMPDRIGQLARSLFGAVAAGDVSKESAWWLLLEVAEDPARALIWSWQHTRRWQEEFPNGITRFGREKFAHWVKETLKPGDVAWLDADKWPDVYPAVDQIRIAYLSSQEWQKRFPRAMHDSESCGEFLEFLNSQQGGGDNDVRNWLATLDKEELHAQLTVPGVNLFGHFSYPSGLRTSTESVGKGLAAQGVRCSLINVPVSLKNDEPSGSMLAGPELFDVSIVHVQPEPFFNEVRQRADIAERRKTPYQIGYWYWEFDSIPPSWDVAAERCDELWTATEFIAKGLRERYRKPVHVFFPGVELPDFRRYPRQHYGLAEDAFVFLFAFHMTSITERKNPLGLMRAFKKAFGSVQTKALLLIKTSFGSSHPHELKRLMDEACDANIRIIDEVYSMDETLSLMDVSDVYISLHRSEGLGLTMAESMLLGKPTIATRFSGNLDFMDDNNSLLIDYESVILEKTIPPYSAGLAWAKPSEDQAAAHMRRLFDDRQFARDLGARAKADLEHRLNYRATGRLMAERVRAISSGGIRQSN